MRITARYVVFALTALFLCGLPGRSSAASTTQTQAVSATIDSYADLTIGSTVTFASADPGSSPSITETESGSALDVTAYARTSTGSTCTLTVLAGSDLTSGSDTIPISQVTWVGTGAGYDASGTLQTGLGNDQAVGSWLNSGIYSGTLTFSLANLYTYHSSMTPYTATLTYTLTAP